MGPSVDLQLEGPRRLHEPREEQRSGGRVLPHYSVDSAYLDYYDESGYYGQSSYLTPVQASLATRYVIQGSDTFTLRIAAPPTRSVEKPAAEGNEDEEDTEANGQPKDEPAEPMAEEPSQPQGERDLNPPEALNAMVYRARRS